MALEEKQVLEKYFDTIAPNYQVMNSLLSLSLDRLWRNSLLKVVKQNKPNLILDIACGTGDVLNLLKDNLPESKLIGLDLSFGMLKTAKEKAHNLDLIRGNGVKTPFQNDSFEAITIAFGFRNMPNLKDFLNEALRILKPGGALCILELTQPENSLLRFTNNIYLSTILPVVASIFAKDKEAYDYLARSIKHFPKQIDIIKLMDSVGYHKTNYQLLHFGITTIFYGIKE